MSNIHGQTGSSVTQRIAGIKVYEVADHVQPHKKLTIQAGGLGDNLILREAGGGGRDFCLGLEAIEAIVKHAKLAAKKTIEVKAPEPAWAKHKIIRADYEGERQIFVKDKDGDWALFGGTDIDEWVGATRAEREFTNVETVLVA